MSYNLKPILIITDFIRTHHNDVKNRITKEGTNTITISNENVVNVTANSNISHITEVKIDGTALSKYVDWVYDLKHNNIIFKTPQTGDLTYDVYTGTNYIYPDEPLVTLNDDAFPRVSVTKVSSVGNVLGNDKSIIVTTYRFQIKTYTKREKFVSVNLYDNIEVDYQGQDLSDYINQKIYEVFRDYRDTLHPHFSEYSLEVKEENEPFDSSNNTYPVRQEFAILHKNETYIN